MRNKRLDHRGTTCESNPERTPPFVYGYTRSRQDVFRKKIAELFVSIFRLNGNSKITTEICQALMPKYMVNFRGAELYFLTGHGRLLWRAETFHSEEPMMIEWLSTFDEGDVFLDVGANVGMYSIAAATIANRVISVELDPNNLYCLHANMYFNRLQDKIIVLPVAASGLKKLQPIYYRDFSIGDALQSVGREQRLPTKTPNPHVITQMTAPIDTLVAEYSLPQPTKIKIDVDGNESDVFSGAWRTISKADEIYFEDNGVDESNEILYNLKTLGFEIVAEQSSSVGSVKSELSRNVLMRRGEA